MSVDYLLHEASVGYAVFKVRLQGDTIGNRLKEVQQANESLSTFGKMVEVVSFSPFEGASQALENANDISEGLASDYLKAVLEVALPKPGKKNKVVIGVSDKNLAASIKAAFPYIDCETGDTSEVTADLLRGLRMHSQSLLKQLHEGDIQRAQLGLGHAYSRAKVKFSVQKNDNHIIQAIATLDHLDKAVNNFAMRVREWYGWHFPELVKIVSDNVTYARLVLHIGDKSKLVIDVDDDDSPDLHALAAIVGDDKVTAKSIAYAAKNSMGRNISQVDMEHILTFAKRALRLAETRKAMSNYLIAKMHVVAPNLATLIGENVGARLIAKAGSLANLSKCAASTVQILGAEKALFRALKTKGRTPKYGLIYHSSFIGRAKQKDKGRISRFLANKCSIASRIDNFSEQPTTAFGEEFKKQVEERMRFYNEGVPPMKNSDAMKHALDASLQAINVADPTGNAAEEEIEVNGITANATEQAVRHKKEKKDKKKKSKKDADEDKMDVDEPIKEPNTTNEHNTNRTETDVATEKKKKKKKREVDGAEDGEKKKKKKSSKSD